jgi:hypothetical protein
MFTEPKKRAYKIMKNLNKTEKDTAQFNNISKDTWLRYYKHLWANSQELELEYNENKILCLDPITWTELDEILKTMKNRKTPGCDNSNLELLKYASTNVKLRFLNILNSIQGSSPFFVLIYCIRCLSDLLSLNNHVSIMVCKTCSPIYVFQS